MDLNANTFFEILQHLSIADIFQLCKSNKTFSHLCSTPAIKNYINRRIEEEQVLEYWDRQIDFSTLGRYLPPNKLSSWYNIAYQLYDENKAYNFDLVLGLLLSGESQMHMPLNPGERMEISEFMEKVIKAFLFQNKDIVTLLLDLDTFLNQVNLRDIPEMLTPDELNEWKMAAKDFFQDCGSRRIYNYDELKDTNCVDEVLLKTAVKYFLMYPQVLQKLT